MHRDYKMRPKPYTLNNTNTQGNSNKSADINENRNSAQSSSQSHQTRNHRSWLTGDDRSPDEECQENADRDPPNPPPSPTPLSTHKEICHKTDIRLKVLIDGENDGDFVTIITKVKVC